MNRQAVEILRQRSTVLHCSTGTITPAQRLGLEQVQMEDQQDGTTHMLTLNNAAAPPVQPGCPDQCGFQDGTLRNSMKGNGPCLHIRWLYGDSTSFLGQRITGPPRLLALMRRHTPHQLAGGAIYE